MKIGIFTRGIDSHSYKYEIAFGEGLRKHNLDYRLFSVYDKPEEIDLAVLWGINRRDLIIHFRNHNINYLVIERGYIGDRTLWTSCGYNGLNGNADFLRQYADNKRLHYVQEYLRPQRQTGGNYILIMGQIPSDAAVKYIGFEKWLKETFHEIKKTTNIPVFYRPHPLLKDVTIPYGLEVIQGDLHDVMAKAHCVVTLNSNSGVDAVLAGIPCITMNKGAMAYSVTDHDIVDILNPKYYDREKWLMEMSYCQWNIEEINNGDAWEHLRRRYD